MKLSTARLVVPSLLALFAACNVPVRADVRPHALFSDHAVLQRDLKLPVWGSALPGEQVTVKLSTRSAQAVADAAGNWRVVLDPLPGGGPFEMSIARKNTITLKDVMLGDVWVAGGQSNMDFPLTNAIGGDDAAEEANLPNIRYFRVPQKMASKPLREIGGAWAVCEPNAAKRFAAAAFFFARDLQPKVGVAIGILDVSWWYTGAQMWMPREVLEKDAEFKPLLESWNQRAAEDKVSWDRYIQQLTRWRQDIDKAEADGTSLPGDAPRYDGSPLTQQWARPVGPYNGLIAPVLGFGIRGVIWYQGESNSGDASQYARLFPAMISEWRRGWGQGDFPFLFVQLPNFNNEKFDPAKPPPTKWAQTREAQLAALRLANTAMVVTIDIGDATNVHPRNKLHVGLRLSLAAQQLAYQKKVVGAGPLFHSMQVRDGKAFLRFDSIGGGLLAKPVTLDADARKRLHETGGLDRFVRPSGLNWFAVAGDDRKFVPAETKIEGDTVIVWHPQIGNPAAVRYAWADNPEGANLYNRDGLPASPFRTDDWQP